MYGLCISRSDVEDIQDTINYLYLLFVQRILFVTCANVLMKICSLYKFLLVIVTLKLQLRGRDVAAIFVHLNFPAFDLDHP